jgi:hypothetical protein
MDWLEERAVALKQLIEGAKLDAVEIGVRENEAQAIEIEPLRIFSLKFGERGQFGERDGPPIFYAVELELFVMAQ